MSAPKEAVQGTPMFFLVDPRELVTWDEWAEYLDSLLNGPCGFLEDGGKLSLLEQRQLVDRVRGLKIEIFFDEHAPPHFHVRGSDVDASFRISDGILLQGCVSARDRRAIDYWYERARPTLIETWNSSRPGDCPVGKFRQE